MTSNKPHIIDLPKVTDPRGNLSFIQNGDQIPFDIQRVYWIYDVPQSEKRGFHASTSCYEYLIAVSGEVNVVLEDEQGRKSYILKGKDRGLLVPPYTWIELTNFSENAVLMVLASDHYNVETYINDYATFKSAISERLKS